MESRNVNYVKIWTNEEIFYRFQLAPKMWLGNINKWALNITKYVSNYNKWEVAVQYVK
jgi:hypothetical protein